MPTALNVITLGRSAERSVDVGPQFEGVSRHHAEIIALGPDSFRLSDLRTPNGTEVLEHGRWVRITQATISRTQRFRLAGQFETSVDELALRGCNIVPLTSNAKTSGGSFFTGFPDIGRLRAFLALVVVAATAVSFGIHALMRETPAAGKCGESVVIYFKEGCPYCEMAERLLGDLKVKYKRVNIATPGVIEALDREYGQIRSVPFLVIDGSTKWDLTRSG